MSRFGLNIFRLDKCTFPTQLDGSLFHISHNSNMFIHDVLLGLYASHCHDLLVTYGLRLYFGLMTSHIKH